MVAEAIFHGVSGTSQSLWAQERITCAAGGVYARLDGGEAAVPKVVTQMISL